METIITTGNFSGGAVTAAQINEAFELAKGALKDVSDKTREFAMRCIVVGELLKAKRDELAPARVWSEWLETNCPEISRMTSHRLISIAEANIVSGGIQTLPDRLSSVRELYESLKGVAAETPEKENAGGKETPPAPSKICSAIARFWGAITRRPPEQWDEMERGEFLTDYAARKAIIEKQGWKVIDVEAETVS